MHPTLHGAEDQARDNVVHYREHFQNWGCFLLSSDTFGNHLDERVVKRNSFCGSPHRNLNWHQPTLHLSQLIGLYRSEFQF